MKTLNFDFINENVDQLVGYGCYCTMWRNHQWEICLFCFKWGIDILVWDNPPTHFDPPNY